MTTIVYCLQVWRHYLIGNNFTIYIDHVVTSCLNS
ncbi:unnamed protein product [Spirodela intermedia]|uniref:Reverse transcriptase RNase H-like domain-containing protein n=2 Tax=Spirodela intermedia TaxID=51605 RepID=A0A7I8JN15_SPIIN|nr:unnamed protein product [Spirodela intermedia]CAA6671201.1 unnamed protein product [Spirodela intermedia]CAA7408309.1 unnamed protein product [Spirodela intermedia]